MTIRPALFVLALCSCTAQQSALLPVTTPPAGPGNPLCKDAVPVARSMPIPPARARGTQQPGWVMLRYDILSNGSVVNARAAQASPEGFFETSALAAIRKWRYQPTENGFHGCQQLIEFKFATQPPPN